MNGWNHTTTHSAARRYFSYPHDESRRRRRRWAVRALLLEDAGVRPAQGTRWHAPRAQRRQHQFWSLLLGLFLLSAPLGTTRGIFVCCGSHGGRLRLPVKAVYKMGVHHVEIPSGTLEKARPCLGSSVACHNPSRGGSGAPLSTFGDSRSAVRQRCLELPGHGPPLYQREVEQQVPVEVRFIVSRPRRVSERCLLPVRAVALG